jgi:hypothetical protein
MFRRGAPRGADRAVYLVLNEFGQLVRAWRETRVVSQFEFIALDGRSRQRSYCGVLSGKQGVDAMTIESPNVKGIWTTIEVDEQGTETVLIVETDLELNAAHPAFDAAKVDALIEAATKSFAASGGTFDRIHLVPFTKPAVKKVRKAAKKVTKKVGPTKKAAKKAKTSAKKSAKKAAKKAR